MLEQQDYLGDWFAESYIFKKTSECRWYGFLRAGRNGVNEEVISASRRR